MKHAALLLALALGACAGAPAEPGAEAVAPPLPEAAEPHPYLARLVGEWEITAEMPAAPGAEPMVMRSREAVRALGPWIVSRMRTEGPTGAFEARLTLAHDDVDGGFTGTWIDTSSSYLWTYRGRLDEAGDTLTLEAEGPAFEDPSQTRLYRDVTEFDGDDRRVLRSLMQGEDGEWVELMRAEAVRLR